MDTAGDPPFDAGREACLPSSALSISLQWAGADHRSSARGKYLKKGWASSSTRATLGRALSRSR